MARQATRKQPTRKRARDVMPAPVPETVPSVKPQPQTTTSDYKPSITQVSLKIIDKQRFDEMYKVATIQRESHFVIEESDMATLFIRDGDVYFEGPIVPPDRGYIDLVKSGKTDGVIIHSVYFQKE